MTLHIIGAAVGSGGVDARAALGPKVLKDSPAFVRCVKDYPNIQWNIIFEEAKAQTKLNCLVPLFGALAKEVKNIVALGERFCVIGGDHSAAIGTWSGAAVAWKERCKNTHDKNQDLGLIWIDAHEDAHTFTTTHSGNIHGMPVSALLGEGHEKLVSISDNTPKIKPQNICLIGLRSYEPEENALLERLGVCRYFIDEVLERGFEAVLIEARDKLAASTGAYGVTLDLDGLDPLEIPAVSTPVPGGISPVDCLKALKKLKQDKQWIGFELMEFNPANDKDNKTAEWMVEALKIFSNFGEKA